MARRWARCRNQLPPQSRPDRRSQLCLAIPCRCRSGRTGHRLLRDL